MKNNYIYTKNWIASFLAMTKPRASLRGTKQSILVVLLCALTLHTTFAQDTLPQVDSTLLTRKPVLVHDEFSYPQFAANNNVNPWRVAIIASAVPITVGGLYIYLQNAWWADQRVPFHFEDDLLYALNLDKAGHFLSGILVSTVFTDLYVLAGIKRKNAVWLGAGTAIVCSTIVEVRDGFAPYWGFSRFDELANILGAMYPVLQYKVPFFRNFNFKWSYSFTKPSYYMSLPENAGSIFLDDYERQNFWLTIDIARMFFPHKDHRKFPYFIDLAIGMSARDLSGANSHERNEKMGWREGYREYFIGFDLNLSKIRFTDSKFEYYVRKYANFYRLPMPTMRVKPDAKAYILNW
ncbi:MAG: YfiM family protein [Bacteroidetes bacterium]|nr:YfiM family protein [Bacteroidota bacterium]